MYSFNLTKSNITGAVYCPLKHNLKATSYAAFLQRAEMFIISGDYNIVLITVKGKGLRKAIHLFQSSFHLTYRPIYWSTGLSKISDLLDLRKVSANFVEAAENFDLDSDYYAIIITLNGIIIKKEVRANLTNKTTD